MASAFQSNAFQNNAFQTGAGQTINAALYIDGDTFYAATVSPGAVNIDAALYQDADTFYAATASTTYAIAAALYEDADSFYAATVSPGVATIAAELYVDDDTFPAATVSASSLIQARHFGDGDTFYAASLSAIIFEFASAGEDICGRCGFIFPERKLKREWTGIKVCEDCFDARHKQDFVRGVPDRQTIEGARPDPDPVYLTTNQVTPESL